MIIPPSRVMCVVDPHECVIYDPYGAYFSPSQHSLHAAVADRCDRHRTNLDRHPLISLFRRGLRNSDDLQPPRPPRGQIFRRHSQTEVQILAEVQLEIATEQDDQRMSLRVRSVRVTPRGPLAMIIPPSRLMHVVDPNECAIDDLCGAYCSPS